MQHRLIAVAALLAMASGAAAQQVGSVRFELRPFAGVYVPTGTQGDDFKSAATYGLQSALEISRNMHVLASAGWTDGRTRIAALSKDIAYIWQYDVGAEFNALSELGYDWLFRPFVGVGAGARTYDYQTTGIDTKTCTAGYASLGSEFERGLVALRLESRGYVHCFKSPLVPQNKTRNDVSFLFGLAYHIN